MVETAVEKAAGSPDPSAVRAALSVDHVDAAETDVQAPSVSRAFKKPSVERDSPHADETAPRTWVRRQPVIEIVDRLWDRFERLIAAVRAGEQSTVPPVQKPQVDTPTTGATDVQHAARSEASSVGSPGVETGAAVVDLPAPTYPPLSRRLGEEGLVLLRVEILTDGSVGNVTVLQDAGFPRLAQAAVLAVRNGRFRPATRNGRAVRSFVRIPFRFVLRESS